MRVLVLLGSVLVAGTLPAQEHPRPVMGAAAAYDDARGRVVVFGGIHPEDETGAVETWEWDGRGWELMVADSAPPPRAMAAMAYDPVRRRVVLFGGFWRNGPLDDTWEWDGHHWVERTGDRGPPGRMSHQLLYDRVGQRIVLIGGMAEDVLFDDIWTWDGDVWRMVHEASEMAVEPFRRSRVLAYRAVLRSELRNLVLAQEVHFADHMRYAESLEALGDAFVLTEGVRIRLTVASSRGWAAEATHEEVADGKCGVFVGSARPPFPEVTTEGEPQCVGFGR